MTIPQFWSRRADWTPGCSISANIEIGHQACQLHVYPAGKEWTDMDGDCVVNITTDTEDHEVLKDESTCTNKENIRVFIRDHPDGFQVYFEDVDYESGT